MTTLLGIAFDFMGMTYYRTNKDVEVGTTVIVETPHGTYPGKVLKVRKPTEEEANKSSFNTLFPEIERIATFSDLDFARNSITQGEKISKHTQQIADQLKLNMKVMKSYLDINEDKVLVTFTSDARVDFRELVRILSGTFHLKIELRQIGPRDQAKLVGGLGPCGLPLCCSTFLKSFDGISISMAKNQLLSINIPKLSGQCGKLMCCLKFEDEAYSKIRPLFPKIGEKFDYNNKHYEVTGLNLLIGNITTYNGDSYETFTKEEYERVKKGLSKIDESKLKGGDLNSGVDLSGHGIKDTANRISQIEKNEKKHREEVKDKFNRPSNHNAKQNSHSNNNNNHPNGKPNNQKPNGNRSFNGKSNHSFNNNHGNNKNRSFNNNPAPKKDSGFIPVSQLTDNQVFDFIPLKKNDKK
jgi:cell fate regulator YaaT (PSP1 superfamily)